MVEKERLSSNNFIPSWVKKEHNARFKYAAKFTKDKIVIDCASGDGTGTHIFAEEAKFVNAFDISNDALGEVANTKKENIAFKIANATNLPTKDEAADLYISLETIEHIEDDIAYLKEVNRVLKKGGKFICSTPNRIVTNPGKNILDKPANKFHVREYSEDEFVHLLKKYFDEVIIVGQNLKHRPILKIITVIGKYAPFHIAVRIHQLMKLLSHPFRRKEYYEIQQKKNGAIFEYITAICSK